MENKQWFFWLAIFVMGIALVNRLEAAAAPNEYDLNGDMSSALQFLRDMDNYYGQIARPRYCARNLEMTIRFSL